MTDLDKLAREWLKRCAPNAEWGDDSALSVFAASVEDLASLLARVRSDERKRTADALEAALIRSLERLPVIVNDTWDETLRALEAHDMPRVSDELITQLQWHRQSIDDLRDARVEIAALRDERDKLRGFAMQSEVVLRMNMEPLEKVWGTRLSSLRGLYEWCTRVLSGRRAEIPEGRR